MTDRKSPRISHTDPSLEPWALELLDQESGASDPNAREELSRVVALLRDLPEPAHDPDRIGRVLLAVADQPLRARVVRAAFGAARRIASPPAALALAAGVAGLLALTVAPGTLPTLLESSDSPVTRASAPTVVATAPAQPSPRPSPVRRRSSPVVRPHFVNVSLFSQAPSAEPRQHYDRGPMQSAYARGLDRQLNQLMIDPDAFAERLGQMAQRDGFVARLADRAAQRGDAAEIALRVRQSRHPLASQLVNQLLRATVVASVSPQR